MNIEETVTGMAPTLSSSGLLLLLRFCSVAPGPGRELRHAGRDRLQMAVVAGAVRRRRLADDLGEPRAERAERRAPHCHTRIGHRHALAKQRLRALDAAGHEIGVRRLAIGR